jgi:ABC-type sugar transport system ATPase subunit
VSAGQPSGAGPPLLAAQGIVKNFGHVHALRGVDFHVHRGETIGLVGDNGAGKSTLLKILCGVYQPDSGAIMVNGETVTFHSARDALQAGIAVVYQDLALVDTRDVAANIFLGREPGGLFVSRREMRRQAATVLADLNIAVPSVRTLVGNLSGGQRQAVAIARAIQMGGRLVIMDEPTAALGVEGQRKVLRLISDLKAQGTSVVVVSHNLEHVFSVSERLVVLRNGRVAGGRARAQTTPEEIVQLMVGAGVEASAVSHG